MIAIDSRRARDGRALEILGFYNPLTDPATVQLDAERVNAWIAKGATPSETVQKLMRQAGMGASAKEADAAPAKRSKSGAAKTTRKTSAKASAKADA